MRSAAVLILVALLGLAIYIRLGRHPKSAYSQPQTSPPPISQPISPFEYDYEKAKGEKERKVVLVFTSEWCPHCVRLKEHLEKSDLKGLLFCFVDTEERPDLVKEYGVRKLPTSVVIKDGKAVSKKVGFSKEEYDLWLSKGL